MLCDKCKTKPATFFSSVNINGNVTETHLCADCANEVNTFNFNSFFGGPTFDTFGISTNELSCPHCGYTLSDYVSTGFLGCSKCYEEFKDYINSNILQFQYGAHHVGKIPSLQNKSDTQSKIGVLEQKLKQAVAEENYELASTLKKQIISLKESENGIK